MERCKDAMQFPRTVDEITAEWLTVALRESGAIRDAAVESFEVMNVGDDQGVAGEVNRLKLSYDRPEKNSPGAIIVKQARQQLLDAGKFGAEMYEREIRFYQEMAPAAGMRTPDVYYAEQDAGSGHFIIILEDLSRLRAVDQADDCSYQDASYALQSLASMHAKWWDDQALYGYLWLNDHPTARPPEAVSARFAGSIDPFLEITDGHLPDGLEAIARKLAPKVSEVLAAVSKPPVTLVHADFRLANIFFDDSGGDTSEIVAFDWQLVGRLKAANDVGVFIMQSLATESRRRHEAKLLSDYHSSLIDHGVKDYSYDEFMYDVRVAVLPRMFIRVNVIAGLSERILATEDGRMRLMGMVERLQTLIDWNCEEVIP